MTLQRENQILASPCTRKLVYEVLDAAKDKDIVDAYYDVKLAADILKARMDRALSL